MSTEIVVRDGLITTDGAPAEPELIEAAGPSPTVAGTFAIYETAGSLVLVAHTEQTGEVRKIIPKHLLRMLMRSGMLSRFM